MTKAEMIKMVDMVARQYGFSAVEGGPFGLNILDDTHTVNFTVAPETKFDVEARKVDVTLKVSASIATMGGNPTPYELITMAERINAAANLVLRLEIANEMNGMLTYTETF